MKYISLTAEGAGREEVLALLNYRDRVFGIAPENGAPAPAFRLSEKNGRICIRCEMIGGPTRDNGFAVGTYFIGRLSESEESTSLRGFIFTAPIYHLLLFALFVFFIVQCVVRQGFSVVPVLLIVFDLFLFWKEFKKQGIIADYLRRAFRILNEEKS